MSIDDCYKSILTTLCSQVTPWTTSYNALKNLLIPDIIMLCNGNLDSWFYSTKNGHVKNRDDTCLNFRTVRTYLIKNSISKDAVCYLRSKSEFQDNETRKNYSVMNYDECMKNLRMSEISSDKSNWEAIFTFLPINMGGIFSVFYEKDKNGKVIVTNSKKSTKSIFQSNKFKQHELGAIQQSINPMYKNDQFSSGNENEAEDKGLKEYKFTPRGALLTSTGRENTLTMCTEAK